MSNSPAEGVSWTSALDAFITGTINTGRVDRRPVLGAASGFGTAAIGVALAPAAAARHNRR